ncbi:MAG: hypothetical protein M3256_26780 [Actinomycetota bacterium]|nr:hypothetical protein [Actinomycetota bacterium]
MAVGAVIVLSEPSQYSATTTLVVLPGQSVGLDAASNYYDTLSHGQITATASHILALKRFKSTADSQLRLSAADASATKIQVTVEAGTSLLSVSATGPTGVTAERLADAVVDRATPTVNSLVVPYRLSIVSRATNTAQKANSLSLGKFLAILVIVGVACAIGMQQAYNQLVSVRRRRPVSAVPTARPSPARRRLGSNAGRSAGTSGASDVPRRTKFPQPPGAGAAGHDSRATRRTDGSPLQGDSGETATNGGGARERAGVARNGSRNSRSTGNEAP